MEAMFKQSRIVGQCPACHKDLLAEQSNEWDYITVSMFGLSYSGYVCRECQKTVTIGELARKYGS